MAIPQDTSLPDDVVERVAQIAVADMVDADGPYVSGPGVYMDDSMSCVGLDGNTDMLRLVRVISAALNDGQAIDSKAAARVLCEWCGEEDFTPEVLERYEGGVAAVLRAALKGKAQP